MLLPACINGIVAVLCLSCAFSAPLLCRAVLYCCQDGKVAKDDLEQWGMTHHELGPDLKTTFELDFGGLLQDDAFRALLHKGNKGGKDQANGFHMEENQWMNVFQEVRVQGFGVFGFPAAASGRSPVPALFVAFFVACLLPPTKLQAQKIAVGVPRSICHCSTCPPHSCCTRSHPCTACQHRHLS